MLATGQLLIGSELAIVGLIGAIGWVISLYCIYDKHKASDEKTIHLINEWVKATFVTITMVAALHLTVQVAIHFPNVALQMAGDEADRVIEAVRHEEPESPQFFSLAAELVALHESGELNEEALDLVGRKHFIMDGIEVHRGQIFLRLPGDPDWTCSFSLGRDGAFATDLHLD